MSNKKRIYRKIKSLETKTITAEEVNELIIFCGRMEVASNHMADAMRYLVGNLDIMRTSIKNVFYGAKGNDLKNVFIEYPHAIKITGKFLTEKSFLEQIPARYNSAFLGLVKVGFSEEDAFETLKETYNF